jgi:hypothetical protein
MRAIRPYIDVVAVSRRSEAVNNGSKVSPCVPEQLLHSIDIAEQNFQLAHVRNRFLAQVEIKAGNLCRTNSRGITEACRSGLVALGRAVLPWRGFRARADAA